MSQTTEAGERRGRGVALAAVIGGVLLAVGGSYLILSSSGLGPSAGHSGAAADTPFPANREGLLDLSGANRACTTNADCVAVPRNVCSPCTCEFDVVSLSEATRHRESAALVSCPDAPSADAPACEPACPQRDVGCLDGQCSAM